MPARPEVAVAIVAAPAEYADGPEARAVIVVRVVAVSIRVAIPIRILIPIIVGRPRLDGTAREQRGAP
jgi:hypothetical protein